MPNNPEGKNITELDIINSISLLSAREGGLMEKDISNRMIGALSGYATDVMITLHKKQEGEISKREARKNIRNYTKSALNTLASLAFDKIAFSAARFLGNIHPLLSAAVSVVAMASKKSIVKKVVEFGFKIISKPLKLIGKLFGL